MKENSDSTFLASFTLRSSKRSSWNWTPPRNEGIWRHGCAWLKPLFAAAPWISLALILSVTGIAANRISLSPGTTFLLPETEENTAAEVISDTVVLLMPVSRENSAFEESVVFFNDSRYILTDPTSADNFRNALSKKIEESENRSVILLSDKRINTGDLLSVIETAKRSGAASVQIAERRE